MRVHDKLNLKGLLLQPSERARIKRLWLYFQPYADTNFAREFASHFHERYWEMCLAYVFLRRRMHLRRRSTIGGPDLVVDSEIGTIWIEATAPGPGTTDDSVPQPTPIDLELLLDARDPDELLQDTEGEEEAVLAPEDAIILRYRTALEEKLGKYVKYLEQGIVSRTEPYIVAINGAAIHPFFGDGAIIPTIAKAVLGLGHLRLVFRQELNGEPIKYIERRKAVRKKSGGEVRLDIFYNENYRGISGVLFSRCDVMTRLRQLGHDFMFVHNPGAINPLPHGWLAIGGECWMDRGRLHVRYD